MRYIFPRNINKSYEFKLMYDEKTSKRWYTKTCTMLCFKACACAVYEIACGVSLFAEENTINILKQIYFIVELDFRCVNFYSWKGNSWKLVGSSWNNIEWSVGCLCEKLGFIKEAPIFLNTQRHSDTWRRTNWIKCRPISVFLISD